MTDIADAAPAAAEPTLVPINEAPSNAPGAIDSSGPEKAPEPVVEQKPAASAREALDRAFAKVEAKGNEPAKPVEAKVDPKTTIRSGSKELAGDELKAAQKLMRDDTGKFAAKTPAESQPAPPVDPNAKPVTEQPVKPTAFSEAPKRFSEDAKANWATAPEPVRAEIHRAVKELETGLSQYREVVEPLKPYLDLAKQNNTTIDKALNQYIGLERALTSKDMSQKLSGIEEVFRHAGISPRDYAAHILNQSPDQVQSQQDSTIRRLEQHIATLEQKLGGVTQTIQQQREQSTLQEINKFAEANPRFEELADDIAFFMKTGRAADLSEAYQLAERLNPAPAKAAAPAPVIPALLDANAQTKGSKSISGAPSQGSSPNAKRPPPKSNREALDRAFAALG